jgi:hypothetical protein
MYCIKFVVNGATAGIREFDTFEDRAAWLRRAGYIETNGVYRRPFIDDEVAGLFTLEPGQRMWDVPGYFTCHYHVSTRRSMWDAILR